MRILLLLLILTQLTWAQRWSPETLDVLSKGEVANSVLLESALEEWHGSNPYLLLTLKDGTRGVFRSEDEPWGSVAEVAGYQLDQLLGTDLVPPTVSRTLSRQELGKAWPWKGDVRPGSLQLFVQGAKPAELSSLSKMDRANSEILGFVTGRYDNHSGNMLQTPDGRAVMIDFEGSLDFQKVRYGDFPYIRRGGWAESPLNVKGDQAFPFDSPRKLVDPSLETIQQTFGPWWGQYWAQGMKSLHGLLRGIPERTIPYIIWNNRLWVQVRVQSRHPILIEHFPPETMEKLTKLQKSQLENIFGEPFRPPHIQGIQERIEQLSKIQGTTEYTDLERAERTADRLQLFYQELGPQAGCILYDPCYVLTLAELRPYGAWNGFKARAPEVRQALLNLNTLARPLGFDFQVSERGGLSLRSLRGLVEWSRLSNFPWVRPFPKNGNFEDWPIWIRKNGQRAEEYRASNNFEGEALAGDFMEGFLLGYPEQAVRQYMINIHDPYHHRRAISVATAYGQYLDNGAPSYDILPEDCEHPQIVEHTRKWNGFLAIFYQLPRVQKRLRSSEFMEARKVVQPKVHHSGSERWWRGDDLKTVWGRDDYDTTRAHELVLYRHIGELEVLITDGRPPRDWAHACQKWAFESEDTSRAEFSGRILRRWFWYGAWSKEGPRGRLYHAVAAVQPKLFEVIARDALEKVIYQVQQGGERDTWDLRDAALLYRHPEFQNIFPRLSPEEKDFVLTDIQENKERKEFKLVNLVP